MDQRCILRKIVSNDAGVAPLQSAMILSVAAVVLLGIRMLWDPRYDGAGGLFAHVESKFEQVLSGGGGTAGGVSDHSGGIDDLSGGFDNSNSGGNDTGGNVSDDHGSGGSTNNEESGGTGGGENESEDDGDPADDESSDNWRDYADIAMSVALESSKLYGARIINEAKAAAMKGAAAHEPLLEAFGLAIGDFDVGHLAARESAFRGAGVLVDALVGVDGLIQGDAKVRELADAGDYRGAWRTTWSTPGRFIADTIFASKAVGVVLDRLPASVQVATRVTVPELIESAAGATADALYDSVALRINEELWKLYDRGLVPRPRIPRRQP